MSAGAACAVVVALVLVLINLNYSLLALALHRLREGRWPRRIPLGIPLLATLAVLVAAWLTEGGVAMELWVLLIAADSGGPLWWGLARLLVWRQRRPLGNTADTTVETTVELVAIKAQTGIDSR